MDEVNLDEFLRETSDAIDDPEKFSQYIREKATIAIERFLVSTVLEFAAELSLRHRNILFQQNSYRPLTQLYFTRTTYRKCPSQLSGVILATGGFSRAMAMMEEGLLCPT